MTSGSRGLTTTNLTASSASTIHPVIFVKMQFDGGNVNLHSELGTITWGGDTYTGAGSLGQISSADEVSDLSQVQLNLTLRGLPNDLISVLLNQQYQGRTATVSLGYLDLTTFALVDTPFTLYQGLIDTADFQQDKTLSINLSISNRFAAWSTPIVRRYNNAYQQGRYSGDTGLQYIEQTTNATVIWGAAQ
jgi:hypothetical protein